MAKEDGIQVGALEIIQQVHEDSINSIKNSMFEMKGDQKCIDLALLRLRECNRNMSSLIKDKKKRVLAAKNALDRTELTRQNLLYERRHLEATIEDTRRHESLYLTIPVIHPELPSEMISILASELEARKKLAENVKSGQESLELARSRLVLKRKELEKLMDRLDTIIKSTEPFLNTHSKCLSLNSMDKEIDDHNKNISSLEAALEKLSQLITVATEGLNNSTVHFFDELEAGEELENGEGDMEDDDDDRSSNVASDSKQRSHARFASQKLSIPRRFSFRHIVVEMNFSNEKWARVYFFISPEAFNLVISLELSDEDELTLEELNLDPQISETIVPNENSISSGVPFRWLQKVVGKVDDETLLDDVFTKLKLFLNAIYDRCTRSIEDGITLEATNSVTPMQIDS